MTQYCKDGNSQFDPGIQAILTGFYFSIDLYKLTKIYVEMQRTKTILKKIKWQTLLYWMSRNYHKVIVLNTVCY